MISLRQRMIEDVQLRGLAPISRGCAGGGGRLSAYTPLDKGARHGV